MSEIVNAKFAPGDKVRIASANPPGHRRVPVYARGREGIACTSCNLCLAHEGHHALRCWRVPRRRLLQHALYRFGGGFGRSETLGLK